MKKLFEKLDLKNRCGPTKRDYVITLTILALVFLVPGGLELLFLVWWIWSKIR